MARADLHCHSLHSEHPSEWFLQRLGTKESYTQPELLYNILKAAGMDYVTLTDHNRIDGAMLLAEKYPDVIPGLEATAYFPEDNCKVHVLVWGLDTVQYELIQSLRTDVYRLRDYLVEQNLAFALAHPTYAVNGRLTVEHLEKALLLFNVFEGVNGGRSRMNNLAWQQMLQNLGPEHLEKLQKKHGIKPYGPQPWIKGLTGGSDDHAALFLGRSYTVVEANSRAEFLACLKRGECQGQGRHNNYQDLAFSIYKIALDFTRTKSPDFGTSLVGQITANLFENRSVGWKQRLKLNYFADSKKDTDRQLNRSFTELYQLLQQQKEQSVDKRLEMAYEKIADIADSFLTVLLQSFAKDLSHGNLGKMLRNISSSLPGIFLTLPFFTALKHMYNNRELLMRLPGLFGPPATNGVKKVLWFTDTIDDLNGVSVTIGNIYRTACDNDLPLVIVSSKPTYREGPHFITLPVVYSFDLPYYEQQQIHIPSVLRAIKKVHDQNPDEIVISTPGPVGLVGLLAAYLLNIPCRGVYHSDFARQIEEIKTDANLTDLTDAYSNWFYRQMDNIMVPTGAYMDILEERGHDRTKMSIFPRGIDSSIFRPKKHARAWLMNRHGLGADDFVLLYSGRISRDKSLDLALDAFLTDPHPGWVFLLAGDGPDLDTFKVRYRHPRIIFAGRQDHSVLSEYYAGADLLVFPSTIDTFGMAVLEAQSCGLPALVSAIGGPREIIKPETTGWVVAAQKVDMWGEALHNAARIMQNPGLRETMAAAAVENSRRFTNWHEFLTGLLSAK